VSSWMRSLLRLLLRLLLLLLSLCMLAVMPLYNLLVVLMVAVLLLMTLPSLSMKLPEHAVHIGIGLMRVAAAAAAVATAAVDMLRITRVARSRNLTLRIPIGRRAGGRSSRRSRSRTNVDTGQRSVTDNGCKVAAATVAVIVIFAHIGRMLSWGLTMILRRRWWPATTASTAAVLCTMMLLVRCRTGKGLMHPLVLRSSSRRITDTTHRRATHYHRQARSNSWTAAINIITGNITVMTTILLLILMRRCRLSRPGRRKTACILSLDPEPLERPFRRSCCRRRRRGRRRSRYVVIPATARGTAIAVMLRGYCCR